MKKAENLVAHLIGTRVPIDSDALKSEKRVTDCNDKKFHKIIFPWSQIVPIIDSARNIYKYRVDFFLPKTRYRY